MQFISQMPMFIKAISVDGWKVSGKKSKVRHLDETRALEPLERVSEWDKEELPETYPTGL